jgi:hypothetical protein
MVVRGEFMREAYADIGKVVDPGTKDYAIVVAANRKGGITYAIRNKKTFVDEFFCRELSVIRSALVEMQDDLDDADEVLAASLRLQ